MPEKLRIGIIGCGLAAQVIHLPYLNELAHLYDIRALATRSETLRRDIGDQYNIPQRFVSYHDLLEEDIDAVFILNRDHTPVILDASAAKRHIFVEKPLCFSLTQADQIKASVDANGVCLMVGYMKRYDPGVLYAQEQIADINGPYYIRMHHAIGSPFRIADEMYRIRYPADTPSKVYEKEQDDINEEMIRAIGIDYKDYRTAYSLLLHLWSHEINLLNGLWGPPSALRYSDVRLYPDVGELPSVQVLAALDFGKHVTCTWTSRAFAENERWDEELAVFADQKTIRLGFPYPYLKNEAASVQIETTNNGRLHEEKVIASFDEAYRRQLLHFHTCVTENKPPLTDIEDSRRDITLCINMIKENKMRRV